MMRVIRITSLMLLLCFSFSSASTAIHNARDHHATILTSTAQKLTVAFNNDDLEHREISLDDGITDRFTIPSEGMTQTPGKPILPAVSRFVVVPPRAGLDLAVHEGEHDRIKADHPPAICQDENISLNDKDYLQSEQDESLYPPVIAEMSEPMVIRGVRLVKVTTYPLQYDFDTGDYIHHPRIETEIRFTDSQPVNPVQYPVRRGRSREFLRFIRALAINGDEVGRDDPDQDEHSILPGHYLVVTHENCLPFAAPFIEWRRKAGWRVDILVIDADDVREVDLITESIQERYNAFLEDSVDPFDHILLIGDRSSYDHGPQPQWILDAPEGNTIWGGANHADYMYACLEGNDLHPDVAISRLPVGSRDLLELAVGKTLMYEATPFMDDPAWFTRGAVFSQHWGNAERTGWRPYIHTNVRWGEELLESLGFDDIAFYEDMNWDRRGSEIGPFIRDVYNEGRNVLTGMAQDYYFVRGRGDGDFNGEVEENVIFPIHLTVSTQGQLAGYIMFRTGDGNNLKGPVATSAMWGYPAIAPMCWLWLELTSGMLQHDLTFGWSRNFSIISIESYFPNIDMGEPLYLHVKTDLDFMGDPGIQPWMGVPREVQVEFPEQVTPDVRLVEITVTDPDGEPVPGARVSLYAPGDIPEPDDEDYADYDGMIAMTTITGGDGLARFVLDEELALIPETPLYITVTGRDILPFFGDVEIVETRRQIEIAEYRLTETEGNGDEAVNPGERFELALTARNSAEEGVIPRVMAAVSTTSPWANAPLDVMIDFGDIPAGEESEGNIAVVIEIDDSCPDGAARPDTRPIIDVVFHSGDDIWRSGFQLDPHAPRFKVRAIEGGINIPIEPHDLSIDVANIGRMDAPQGRAELISSGLGISVIRNEVDYPAINAGRHAVPEDEPLIVTSNQRAVPGSRAEMLLIFSNGEGFVDSVWFELQVREPMRNAPGGPDDYGYICFDDTDEEWDMAPEYDWIEISAREDDREFNGELMGFEDQAENDIGESIVIELPFETQFYGELYDRITVCTKGFIAMGDQPNITNYQPWPMDQAIGGGVGMIAPFWADISFDDESGVYIFHDENESRFIIEWYRLQHRNEDGEDLTFQVILYNHDVWITETGDQSILFQYRSIENRENTRNDEEAWINGIPYASVGISSPPLLFPPDDLRHSEKRLTGINYTFADTYPITSSPLENRRAILFTTTLINLGSAVVWGRVFDAADEDVGLDATLYTQHGFSAHTSELGDYSIEVLAGIPFDLTATAEGYNDSTRTDLFVDRGDSLEVNFGLLHGEFLPSVESFEVELDSGQAVQLPLLISNAGNGYLQWRVEKRLLGADPDPWQIRRSVQVGQIVEDDHIEGVVYIDGRYYVSGGHDGEPVIYVLDWDDNLLETFPQFNVDDRRGMRDLAWDGDLIWGTVERTVYGFTTQGELITNFDGPFRPVTSIAYDSDLDVLWISSIISDVHAVTREGVEVDSLTLNRHDLRIYGLAYMPEDRDGFPLYVFNRDPDTRLQTIHKFNTTTGDTQFVTHLESEEEGSPGGAFITDQLDIYSWVFMTTSSVGRNAGGDQINIWQLDSRREWFNIEPTEGRIQSGDETEFAVTFDTGNWFVGMRLEGEFVFFHNAADGEDHIPVTVDVLPASAPNENNSDTPTEFGIADVYPNPFNATATITFGIEAARYTRLSACDVSGREVAILYEGVPRTGDHHIAWNAGSLPSGIYLLRLESAGRARLAKTVLVK